MQMKVCTANKFTQSTGPQYAKWNHLENLMWGNHLDYNKYAITDLVRGYSLWPNRPARLTLTDFQCNLPPGSRVKEIRIRPSYNGGYAPGMRYKCEAGSPEVGFVGTPTNLGTKRSGPTDVGKVLIWTNTDIFKCDYDASVLNSPNFGIYIDFPRNQNNIRGYVLIRQLYIEVYYISPEFEITIGQLKGKYKTDTFEITATISNKTDTYWIPVVTIRAPAGFQIEGYSARGIIYHGDEVNPDFVFWNPALGGVSSDTITIQLSTDIDFGDSDRYTGTFLLLNDYTQILQSLDVTVERYMPYDIETIDFETRAVQYEDFKYVFKFNDTEMTNIRRESQTGYVEFNYIDLNGDVQSVSVPDSEWPSTNEYEVTMVGEILGTRTIKVGYADDTTVQYYFQQSDVEVIPQDENARKVGMDILAFSEEELNRLGHGIVYTAQTWLKIDSTTQSKVHDWKYNFRLGIFNEGIPENITVYEHVNEDGEIEETIVDTTDYGNLTKDQILDNCVWSDAPTDANGWNNLTCTFRYNKEYPLYIVITGDCRLAPTILSPRFTEPTVAETISYKGSEPNGTFPVPILNTLTTDRYGTMNMSTLTTANTLVYYGFDIEQEFGEKYVIKGISVDANVYGDNSAIASKLFNNGTETGNHSIFVNGEEVSMGGYGDLWGFKTNALKSFEDLELYITPSNTMANYDISYSINNIRLSLYIEEPQGGVIKTYIDDEDLDYYGVFLTDLKIPEGLKTDTDYLTVNGTDFNDPYMQSIREKEIEIDFDLGGPCDIYGNTVALRQLTKLLVNERDKYNRPIPKKLEFSHYPDVYWEYILEDGFTPELDINTYTAKVKLTIPAGTAFSKEDITTTGQGYVNGLTHINPIIQIKPYRSTISLTDTISKQHFNLGYTNFENHTMRIDCRNRKVWLIDDETTKEVDISKYVDRNSDWFRILGYFNLEATGCIIQYVSFKERW